MHIDVLETIKRLTNHLLDDDQGINELAYSTLIHLNGLVGLKADFRNVRATNGRYYSVRKCGVCGECISASESLCDTCNREYGEMEEHNGLSQQSG